MKLSEMLEILKKEASIINEDYCVVRVEAGSNEFTPIKISIYVNGFNWITYETFDECINYFRIEVEKRNKEIEIDL